MGTSKHVAILLTVALTGIVAAAAGTEPDKSAASPSSQRRVSNTRQASAIVRITVDPAILPLSRETVDSLVHSPSVLLNAARDALPLEDFKQLSKLQDGERSPITIRWLNTSSGPASSGARFLPQGQGANADEMMRMPRDFYGPAYMEQMMGSPSEEKSGGTKEGQAAEPSQTGSSPRPGQPGRAEGNRMSGGRFGMPGMGASGGGGGMGGMGMGGMAMPGMGMGGMGGGMMGGYGGMGGGGFYGAPAAPQRGAEQSATIELRVSLPDPMSPVADELLGEVVRNLQNSLSRAYEAYQVDLHRWLSQARDQRRAAEMALEGTADNPAAAQEVRRRLNTMVDLSALKPAMALNDAVELLKRSVEPPLNIVVLWSNLFDYVQVKPTTPVNIDGMASIRLGTALDLLVKGIPSRLGPGGPTWKIQDDVIVIGTVVALMGSRESAAQPKVEADAVNLAGQRSELTRKVQALELDLAGIDARAAAIAAQTAGVRQRVSEKLSTDPVMRELEKLSQIYSYSSGSPEEREKAVRAKIELANRREELSRQVGGSQLEEFNKELSRMAIDKAEKEAQLKIVRKQLDEVQRQLAQALTFDPEAARLRLAQESLDITARRVAELQTRIANLQPPTVIVIGAN